MSIWEDELKYINKTHSQAYISSQTGIPQSTLSYVLSDQRSLPDKYTASVNMLYGHIVADNLTQYGMPENQAQRFIISNPSTVQEIETYVKDVAHNLAQGQMIAAILRDDYTGNIQAYINENFDDVYTAILESMRRSEKPIEEWSDYF